MRSRETKGIGGRAKEGERSTAKAWGSSNEATRTGGGGPTASPSQELLAICKEINFLLLSEERR
jgi:hypothetical protein